MKLMGDGRELFLKYFRKTGSDKLASAVVVNKSV